MNFDTDIQFVFTENISPNEIYSDVDQVMKEEDIKNLLVSTSIEVKENKENIRANIHVKYSVKKEDYILAEKKIDEWAKKNIKKNMSDYDKVKTIHDYIIQNITYSSTGKYDTRTYISGILDKKAACEGYANLFYKLAKKSKLEVNILAGMSRGLRHAWNQVKINGKWYNVDVTFDDPLGDRGNNYSYFLRSNKYFSKNHELTDKRLKPAPSDYDRKKIIGNYIENEKDLIKYIHKNIRKGVIKINYGGTFDLKKLRDIISQGYTVRKVIFDDYEYIEINLRGDVSK